MVSPVETSQAATEPTIHGGWVLTFIRVIESYGCDADGLLNKVGLGDRGNISSVDRIPFSLSEPLWNLAAEETGDPCIGLQMHAFFNPATFHALGIALLSSSSLQDALQRLARYGKVLGSAGEKSFTETPDNYCFRLTALRHPNGVPVPSFPSLDGFFAVLVSICRELYSDTFNPLRVELIRPKPSGPDKFQDYFRAPVIFSADDNCIYFKKSEIEAPLASGDRELVLQLEELLSKRLASYGQQNLIALVKDQLIALLPNGTPSESHIAKKLNISERTLQRKLKDENCSFRELLATTRQSLACQHLKDLNIPVNEISFLLGYSEETNFARAFKRWTGMSPSEYRNNNS